MEIFFSMNVVMQAFIASIFTFLITSLGSAIVFFFKKVNKNIMDSMLGLAAGVMISASYFSLLAPAISQAESLNMISYIIVSFGFLLGGLLLYASDIFFTKKLSKKDENNKFKRMFLLISSIVIHNIPEGLSIGVAFGSAFYHIDGATSLSALGLAIGIGIQNFPEGSAISLPLRREGMSRTKSFLVGALSGIVEPISAVVGALLVLKVINIMPILLAFAAGAMIYVVVEELIPESQTNEKKDLMALWTIIGFIIMMILDIALG